MKKFSVRFAVLVVLLAVLACASPPPDPTATPVQTATAAPTATPEPPVNRLSNPGLEMSWEKLPVNPIHEQPSDWQLYEIITDSHTVDYPGVEGAQCYNFSPEIMDMNDPAHVAEGDHSMVIRMNYSSSEAGMYQLVEVEPNTLYTFTAQVKAVSTNPESPVIAAIGIDTHGGVDPSASTIVWTHLWYDKANDDNTLPDSTTSTYQTVTVTAVSASNYLTVYTYGFARWCDPKTEVYFDDLSLVQQ